MEDIFDKRRCSVCKDFQILNSFNGKWKVCKVCDRIRRKEKVAKARSFVIEYLKEHPCVICGEKDIVVLVFDHLRDKKKMISTLIKWGYSVETIKKEIEKCRVLCANCHCRVTCAQQSWKKAE